MDMKIPAISTEVSSHAGSLGFHFGRLEELLKFAVANDSRWPRSMHTPDGIYIGCAYVEDKPPYDQVLGPVTPRGGPNGLILRRGKLVARWGDTERADMTFSIAKSYLALLAGLAVDRKLIASLDDRVGDAVKDGGFDDPHNSRITWRHLLTQTSEWRGTLFERPDSVDWNREVGPNSDGRNKGLHRELRSPGEHYEYNDVRVNRLALALLRVWGEPLPDILAREIMAPMSASPTWRWDGYQNSWVDVGGRKMQSVTGGGHWGGGLVINSEDHALVGELVLGRGKFRGRQLISDCWISEMLTPSDTNPNYGLLWWLNTDRKLYPSAPATSVFALGGGQHMIWVDEPRELVVVLRWLHKPVTDQFFGLIADAIKD